MTEHACPACAHDCPCQVKVHTDATCPRHEHEWVSNNYDGYGLATGPFWCRGCRRTKESVDREERERRERQRRLEMRQEMGA